MSDIEDIIASRKREIERQSAEIDVIRAIIREHAGIDAEPHELATWPYLLSLIRAHPRELLDSPEYAEAVKAMRTLARLLPILSEKAEALASEAKRKGQTTWLDRYAEHTRAVEDSIKPFTLDRRDKRGWWHGWARTARIDVALVLHRHGVHASFNNATAPAVKIMVDLLQMAGHAATPAGVIEALSE